MCGEGEEGEAAEALTTTAGGRSRACGSFANVFDEARRHLRLINAVARIADRTPHPSSATAASIFAFPRLMRMGFTSPMCLGLAMNFDELEVRSGKRIRLLEKNVALD
jgi:hypothetical protein